MGNRASSEQEQESDQNAAHRRGSSPHMHAANGSQSLQGLRAECVELGVTAPPQATKEELLELVIEARNKKRPSLWRLANDSYGELVNAIIRPPRAVYSPDDLGRRSFSVDGIPHERHDFSLVNNRGLKIMCSWWRPRDSAGMPLVGPCCVYLHGNSSCRAEALGTLPAVLGARISLFAFDFSGSGLSEGEYVSLGFYEREDLQVVVNYLRESNRVSTIGLWGRSMVRLSASSIPHELTPQISSREQSPRCSLWIVILRLAA